MLTGAKWNSPQEAKEDSEMYFRALIRKRPRTLDRTIKAAYHYADIGALKDEKDNIITLYRVVDYKQTSDLIRAFERFFKEKMGGLIKSQQLYLDDSSLVKHINEKKLNEELVEQLNWAIGKYKENGKFDYVGTPTFLYDRLKVLGKNPTTDARFSEFLGIAEKQLKKETENRLAGETRLGKRQDLKNLIEFGFPEKSVSDKAKEIAINDMLESWTKLDMTAKDIIE